MPELVLFLDDGGVMNDNSRRGPQWQELVGAFFVPVLGGSAAAWGDANRVITTRMFAPATSSQRAQAAPDYVTFERTMQIAWLHEMCAFVGVAAPGAEESVHLARRASAWVTQRVQAAYPGAVAALRELRRRGYTLHTASGESSLDLTGYLTAMGVRDCFDRLYGPDLLATFKPTTALDVVSGPIFYQRMFAAAGVPPDQALVVDDNAASLAWAAQAGARTLLVAARNGGSARELACIGSLTELPAWLERYA